jgi:hypothetical protein
MTAYLKYIFVNTQNPTVILVNTTHTFQKTSLCSKRNKMIISFLFQCKHYFNKPVLRILHGYFKKHQKSKTQWILFCFNTNQHCTNVSSATVFQLFKSMTGFCSYDSLFFIKYGEFWVCMQYTCIIKQHGLQQMLTMRLERHVSEIKKIITSGIFQYRCNCR